MTKEMQLLELLAPARDREVAFAAIDCGADAVYIGGPDHGARASASNSVEDIRAVCEYAHRFRAKVYVTFNTLIYENELDRAAETVKALYSAGVDALIVQDMAVMRMDVPPIALHASTQCDARTADKVAFLADCGMSCVVLPREMSIAEIRDVHRTVPGVRLEAFVHGALCVSYSGDCRASLVNGGRSANRGECAQICRLPYDLCDADGNVISDGQHFLSLRDMNRIAHVAELADAGVSSFKIEGRLKDKNYVMNVVSAYSQALDAVVAANSGRYRRASYGISTPGFVPDVNKTFNRGYCDYFATREPGSRGGRPLGIAGMRTPKFVGPKVATVIGVKGRQIRVRTVRPIANGDGLTFFDKDGIFAGFRVNKVEGNIIHTTAPVAVETGTPLYRNSDKKFEDAIGASRPARQIKVDMSLTRTADGIALELSDSRGCKAVAATVCQVSTAEKPQSAKRVATLSKLGDTIYCIGEISDLPADVFVPVSVLTALRRDAIAALDAAAASAYPFEYRKPENKDARVWADSLTFHDNVANSVAREFYKVHGVRSMAPAMECEEIPSDRPVHVMTCRYCLRRELGACLRTPDARKLPDSLVLRPLNPNVRSLKLSFDCDRCLMLVHALPDL